MDERAMTDLVKRAIGDAHDAWGRAHRGLPANPMARTAAIPAIGIIAASILHRLPMDDEAVTELARKAIEVARRAWEESGEDAPSNPMARTAEKAAIGIVAAGILNYSLVRTSRD
jgi:hypothetical protein